MLSPAPSLDSLSRLESNLTRTARELDAERSELDTRRQQLRSREESMADKERLLNADLAAARHRVGELEAAVASAEGNAAASVHATLEKESDRRVAAEQRAARLEAEIAEAKLRIADFEKAGREHAFDAETLRAQVGIATRRTFDADRGNLEQTERSVRLALLLSESASRSEVWELAARFQSAESFASRTATADLHRQMRQLEEGYHTLVTATHSQHEGFATGVSPQPTSRHSNSVMSAGGHHQHQHQAAATPSQQRSAMSSVMADGSTYGSPVPGSMPYTLSAASARAAPMDVNDDDASPPRRLGESAGSSSSHHQQHQSHSAVVLSVRIRELERALGNAMSDLERERSGSRELRSALEQLYTVFDSKTGSFSPARKSGGGEAAAGTGDGESPRQTLARRRDDVAAILASGEMAKLRTDLEVERGRIEALQAANGKLALQLRESTDECAKLNVECETLSTASRRLQAEQRQDRGAFAALEMKFGDLQREHDAMSEEASKLRADLQRIQRVERQAAEDLRGATDINEHLQHDLQEAKAKLAQSGDAAGANAIAASLKTELEACRATSERQTARLEELIASTIPTEEHESKMQALRHKIGALERCINEHEGNAVDASAAADRAAEDSRSLAHARSTIAKLEEAMREMEAASNTTAAGMSQQAVRFQERAEALSSENSTLRFQLHSSQQRLLHAQEMAEEAAARHQGELQSVTRMSDGSATEREDFLARKLLDAADEIERLNLRCDDQAAEIHAIRRAASSSSAPSNRRSPDIHRGALRAAGSVGGGGAVGPRGASPVSIGGIRSSVSASSPVPRRT